MIIGIDKKQKISVSGNKWQYQSENAIKGGLSSDLNELSSLRKGKCQI